MPRLETTEVVLVHGNIVSNEYQCLIQFKCLIHILLGQLSDVSCENSILLKTFNPEFLYIEV